jgi:hypothetical protein
VAASSSIFSLLLPLLPLPQLLLYNSARAVIGGNWFPSFKSASHWLAISEWMMNMSLLHSVFKAM